MTTSPKLGIPLISGQQAQPEVTHNQALLCMQALLGGAEGVSNAPPGSPNDGDTWIIGDTPSGVWTGKDNKLAIYFAGMWIFLPGVDDDGADIPMGDDQVGMSVWQKDISDLVVWLSGSLGWTTEAGAVGLFLEKANNLSDVANAATARTNLGVQIGLNVQAWDANLDAVAALVAPATTITGAAQKTANLSDLANASTARTNLGVAIGSNVEAWDADLDAVAALSTTGMLARTAAATFVPRTITGSGGVTVTNGNGVAGAPAITLSASGGPYVLKSGDTMTGPLISAVGSIGAPGIGWAGDTTTGFFWGGAGLISWQSAGAFVGQFSGVGVLVSVSGGGTASSQLVGEAATQFVQERVSTDASAANSLIRKSRGTIASRTVPVLNDGLGAYTMQGYNGSTYTAAVSFSAALIETGTVGSAAMGGRARILACAIGSGTQTEIVRFETATGLSMFGANVVIDANRNHQLRSYTIATLPTATAGLLIHCSDLGGGSGQMIGDGTNFKRVTRGYETQGDADKTLQVLTNAEFQNNTATLTANRTTTLGTTNAYKAACFNYRTTGLGAFTMAFVNGGGGGGTLITFPALTAKSAQFVYDGTNWVLMQDSII